jgi:hypothetical protein
VAIAAAGWWSLRREALFLGKRNYYTLVVLRVLPFIVLIFLLMKPILIFQEESSVRRKTTPFCSARLKPLTR